MHLLRGAAGLAALLGLAPRQFAADSSAYVDKETGLTYASYTSDRGIIFRVAVPDTVPTSLVYDTVLQIVSPIAVGWAGLAWGGSMTYNPLAITWANGTHNVVITSRYAYGYYVPPVYPSSNYTVLKTGTHINATHWQITAKCTGCTKWGDDSTGVTTIDPKIQNTIAFAYSNTPVDTPADAGSSFGIHDSIGHPVFDLSVAENKNFTAAVAKLA
ncbi:hypothetical protein QBC46DRAFT_283506 [Diplogelasinospora grovesii]|uniref:DOMON domain-containing protein n=1 Tax=Diplogelasinospora grovesii TaxID=303347 RepID=A0AAN6NBB3_9PEZI|nr:hypothetical protein QBC46DRAFT_283506 [Diplogelasinospora grovesii]